MMKASFQVRIINKNFKKTLIRDKATEKLKAIRAFKQSLILFD